MKRGQISPQSWGWTWVSPRVQAFNPSFSHCDFVPCMLRLAYPTKAVRSVLRNTGWATHKAYFSLKAGKRPGFRPVCGREAKHFRVGKPHNRYQNCSRQKDALITPAAGSPTTRAGQGSRAPRFWAPSVPATGDSLGLATPQFCKGTAAGQISAAHSPDSAICSHEAGFQGFSSWIQDRQAGWHFHPRMNTNPGLQDCLTGVLDLGTSGPVDDPSACLQA